MRILLTGLAICALVAADAAQDAVKKELGQLQGEWTLVSGERDGQDLPEDIVKNATRNFKGDEATVTLNGQVILKAKITLDPSKKPKTLDYAVSEGEAQGQTIKSIYELDGDKLKVCSSAPGGERPKEFNTKDGNGQTLSVWKRAKK